jgi:isoleucyl-tRNA synthetase
MFKQVPTNVKFPELEEEILAFWREHAIYEQTLARRTGAPTFVFYEGPPTANGMPHPGHCLTRAIKDLFPRYRTMRGFLCERKAGWDTHGLPVEVEVCKELGIHSKEEIEQFGVEPFIHRCQESVWRYMKQWEQLTERLGFWIHLDEAYVTYHQSYVESVWWSLKQLFDRGLLYQGHKIVWWWAQGGTALSAGEVGQGYRQTADQSVYVTFPLLDENNTSLLVWTTTPWTLPNNQFAAVHPDLDYVTVRDEQSGEKLVMAAALYPVIAEKAKRTFTVEVTRRGAELLGKRYRPPFDYYYAQDGQRQGRLRDGGTEYIAWRVVPATFVTVDSGTGVVHQAPAFGEVDYEVLLAEQARFVDDDGPPLICGVGPDGRFTSEVPDFAGRWVKDADKDLILQLRQAGLLLMREQYLHEYPFCWRAEDDPLIQYPRKSWFIRTTEFKERMLANNARINWLPEHIRDGRFGNFLETNVDWALSRERYWGTPLPIWVCDKTGRMEAVASYAELEAKPGATGFEIWEQAKLAKPEVPDDLRVHKPYIDAITYDSPFAPGGRMRRVPEVIDCWYDSGAMPFAQWGYPHANRERFAAQFPADFISEALDQTRGWFYSLLAISTLLFGDQDASDPEATFQPFPHPYRTCIVLGLMLAEWWESADGKERFLSEAEAREQCGKKYNQRVGKMSKHLRNYRSPQEIFDVHGADALRWYLFANQAPWNSIIYSERAIKESIPEFLLRLWNVYSFLVIYANIDGFDPSALLPGAAEQLDSATLARGQHYRPVDQRAEIDQWILSELHQTICAVVGRMDAYDNYGACTSINAFVDALSNWYVRRNRDRFWSGDEKSADKFDAYWTLYECLITVCKLIAPFVPFVAESMWRNLAGVFGTRVLESVHLCDYPVADPQRMDRELSERMELLREIASLGRSARMNAKLKVRQPLALVEVILASDQQQAWLEAHHALLQEELNVKEIAYTTEGEKYIAYVVQPNFKRLGPRVGRLMPAVKQALSATPGAALLTQLRDHGHVTLQLDGETLTLDRDDVEVRLQAREGWTAAQGPHVVVVLSTDLTPQLIREGYAQDLKRLIQDRRKALQCQYTDRICVGLETQDDHVWAAVEENRTYLQQETLATEIVRGPLTNVEAVECEVAEAPILIYVQRGGGCS